jgi:hypothetical protein
LKKKGREKEKGNKRLSSLLVFPKIPNFVET